MFRSQPTIYILLYSNYNQHKKQVTGIYKQSKIMILPYMRRYIFAFFILLQVGYPVLANESLFRQARSLQYDRKYDEAIQTFKNYLTLPDHKDGLTGEGLVLYTEALMQLMNTFQSKGEPEACISALQEVYNASPTLQKQCLRDFYSVMGMLCRVQKRCRKPKKP